jgi:hypothetical protein
MVESVNRIFKSIWTLTLAVYASAGDPLTELGEGLDLSILKEPEPTAMPEEAILPARHLFAAFDQAPRAEAPPAEKGLQTLELPAALYLVTPNPARIDTAYRHLHQAVDQLNLQTGFPLKIVLHTDGNFSVGCRIKQAVEEALPAGTDISPQPATRLAGLWRDIQIADKTHPLVIQAVVDLRQAALEQEQILDTSEIYFLPVEPGKVFVGMRVN